MHMGRVISLALIAAIASMIVLADLALFLTGKTFLVPVPVHIACLVGGVALWLLFAVDTIVRPRLDRLDRKLTRQIVDTRTLADHNLKDLGIDLARLYTQR